MSGLRKAKEYDWKDSNMALFGSDTEKQVKKDSAKTEPAWEGAGEEVGMQIWRIEKFKIAHWPKEEYGKFYNGDSYILLNTYKEEEEICWDVHFWIGKNSTQDEYGTAAYKTVELDTYLDDGPVQHREVGNHESSLFKSYFDDITYMDGGCASGFRHVEPEQYEPRFFLFKKEGRKVNVKQIPMRMKNLNSGDVFIMDLGRAIYQWNGRDSSKDERFRAAQYCQQLESERNGKANAKTLEEDAVGPEHEFMVKLQIEEGDYPEEDVVDDGGATEKRIVRISDASGQLEFTEVQSGDISKDALASEDVFIIDSGDANLGVIVWVGSGASVEEKRNGMSYAHKYLSEKGRFMVPVTVVKEGTRSKVFDQAF